MFRLKITGVSCIVASKVVFELMVGSDNWRIQLMSVGGDIPVLMITLCDVTGAFVDNRGGWSGLLCRRAEERSGGGPLAERAAAGRVVAGRAAIPGEEVDIPDREKVHREA